jgi:hypothetical protein
LTLFSTLFSLVALFFTPLFTISIFWHVPCLTRIFAIFIAFYSAVIFANVYAGLCAWLVAYPF